MLQFWNFRNLCFGYIFYTFTSDFWQFRKAKMPHNFWMKFGNFDHSERQQQFSL